jgi:hypothetical protein
VEFSCIGAGDQHGLSAGCFLGLAGSRMRQGADQRHRAQGAKQFTTVGETGGSIGWTTHAIYLLLEQTRQTTRR